MLPSTSIVAGFHWRRRRRRYGRSHGGRLGAATSAALLVVLLSLLSLEFSSASESVSPDSSSSMSSPPEYGTDISYPMHQLRVSTNYPWLPHNNVADDDNEGGSRRPPVPPEYVDMPLQPMGDRQSLYEQIMESCRRNNNGSEESANGEGSHRCDDNEAARIAMNLRQPRSMVNYTETGYKKIRTPQPLMDLLLDFWMANRGNERFEAKTPFNIFTNSYDSPSYLLDVGRSDLVGGGTDLRDKLWDAARDTIQEWTGQRLVPSSLYGIRIYGDGAVLAPHVDRLPLISSAIINVAQDVDEDWPLEVIGHGGKAINVTMKPGDLVLYESHSIIHGRPFALKGRYYANIFIHFVPEEEDDDGELPSYIVPGSPVAHEFIARSKVVKHNSPAHEAAAQGDVRQLQLLSVGRPSSKSVEDVLDAPDRNGWRPLHEAVRSGSVDAVRFLLDRGNIYVNSRTGPGGDGLTPFRISMLEHGPDHAVTKLLASRGGVGAGFGRMERHPGTGTTELHIAAAQGNVRLIETLLPPGHVEDVDIVDELGWTPLHEAARAGKTESIRTLLGLGANVNARTRTHERTPLYWAYQFGFGEDHPSVKLLVQEGGIL